MVQFGTIQYSMVGYTIVQYSTLQYGTVQYGMVQYSTVQSNFNFHVTVLYHAIMYSDKGVRGQKFSRVSEFKRCQGCQGTKVFKGAKV